MAKPGIAMEKCSYIFYNPFHSPFHCSNPGIRDTLLCQWMYCGHLKLESTNQIISLDVALLMYYRHSTIQI